MRKWILAVVFIVIIAGAWYAYKEYNRTHTDMRNEKATATLSAASLIEAFEKDSAAAGKQYTDRVVAVQGTVKKIVQDQQPVVIFLGEEAEMSSVQCSMDSTHMEYKNLRAGTAVTIKGLVTGYRTDELFGTDVILNRCVMENNK
jgi:hypothetical protein